jgi:hypothetical protein
MKLIIFITVLILLPFVLWIALVDPIEDQPWE